MRDASTAAVQTPIAGIDAAREGAELSRRTVAAVERASPARRRAIERAMDVENSALRTWAAAVRAAAGPTPFDETFDLAVERANADARDVAVRWARDEERVERAVARRYDTLVDDYVAFLDAGATLASDAMAIPEATAAFRSAAGSRTEGSR